MVGVTNVDRIGIFGGTFDPPHLGHLILAAEAHYQLELDRVLWVLTPDPPHKRGQPITPTHLRLEMVRAALSDAPEFELSMVDVDRQPPHYALDTVRILQQAHPQAQLIYLMGADSLRDLPAWHRPREFVQACHELGVMRRPGVSFDFTRLEPALPGVRRKARFIDTPMLEIASHEIRARVREGRPYRFFLPPAVYRLIRQRGLYR